MTAARDLAFNTLRLEQSGRVLTVRIFCPPQNFGTIAFVRELDQLTSSVDHDPTIGAVVLTGGIEGRWLTHLDAQELGGMTKLKLPRLPMRVLEFIVPVLHLVAGLPGVTPALERFGGDLGKGIGWLHRWKRITLRMNRSRAVYIAAINGPTLDGGLEIALACDLRYTTDWAQFRIGQGEMLVGVIPGGGGSQRLLRILGTARALEHILEGAPLTAAEALALGIIHRVVPDQHLIAEAQATGARLARRAPLAVAALKRCIYFGMDRRL